MQPRPPDQGGGPISGVRCAIDDEELGPPPLQRRMISSPSWSGTSAGRFHGASGRCARSAIREAAKTEAVTRVVAWQLTQEMERQGMTKAALAERMHTSRAQVDRILKAKGNITIETLQRAAALVGRELRLELV
jgi:DNA-binding phage protein